MNAAPRHLHSTVESLRDFSHIPVMQTVPFPKMIQARQVFPPTPPVDIISTVTQELEPLRPRLKPGARIAVGVGSRGITNLQAIVSAVVEFLKKNGADPFIIPAMGSHGGATPEGQAAILAEYGITQSNVGAPIKASLEVKLLGKSEDDVEVHCSTEALQSDGILLVNRIKPHTDFHGNLGSGILKMSVIGLGKRTGAAAMHVAANWFGHERVIRNIAKIMFQNAPILGGLAILENQFHQTAKIALVPPEEVVAREEELLLESRKLFPTLPFEEIDLLIIDQIGKNVSGAGMDPNVIGRGVHGYSSALPRNGRPAPFVRRIFVRDLTPETHGNAIGIGFADFTTTRLVQSMELKSTYINSLTSMTPQGAKIPIYFDTDREVLTHALISLALPDLNAAKVVRIQNTLSIVDLHFSESFLVEGLVPKNLDGPLRPEPMQFDSSDNLLPFSD
jgi:hypothetical protein